MSVYTLAGLSRRPPYYPSGSDRLTTGDENTTLVVGNSVLQKLQPFCGSGGGKPYH